MTANNYSLLVVDDESLARESIIASVDWDKLAINRILEAENGREALRLIKNEKPDIVILDIRMPEMNGMELLDKIRDQKLDVQIIVSSGYSDFEYARKMLSIGKVVDYLLKPISEDLIIESVVKCIEIIESKRTHDLLKGHYQSARNMIHWQFVKTHVFGYPQETADKSEPLPDDTLLQVALVYCADSKDELICALRAELQKTQADLRQYFLGEDEHDIVLYFESSRAGVEDRTKIFCRQLTSEMEIVIGLGRTYKDICDLRLSYQESQVACTSSIFNKKNMIAINELESQSVIAIEIDSFVQEMRSAIIIHDENHITHLLEQIFNSFMAAPVENQKIAPGDLSLVKARMAYFLEAVLAERKEWLNLSIVYNAKDIRAVFLATQEVLCQGDKLYANDKRTYKTNLMRKVKTFIEENYQKRLTLDEAAGIIFINPSYLSRLFSETEGCVFTDYVTQIRIYHAKELLNSGQYRIYEIAEMVGYSNAKYFIRVFKEREGLTPAQYRCQHMYDQ